MEMQRNGWECIIYIFKFYSRSFGGCEKAQGIIRPCCALIERMRGRLSLKPGMLS